MKTTYFALFLILVAGRTSGGTASSSSHYFQKTPYSVLPSSNSVTIMWQSTAGSSDLGYVQYGTNQSLDQTVSNSSGWMIEGEGYVHEITLTGLTPFTRYYYRAGDGHSNMSSICSAKTAPGKGRNFRIVSVADTHDNHCGIWESMNPVICAEEPDLVMFIGDLVNDGSMRTTWDRCFFEPGEPVLSSFTMSGSIGNHETYNGVTTYYDYFSFPTHPDNGEPGERDPKGMAYFSFPYGDVRVIAININNDDYSPAFSTGSEQLTWLDHEIASATEKWIFIFHHVCVLSTSYHAQWSEAQKTYILPVYETYAQQGKRILVFSGDEHNFEHLCKDGVNYFRPGCANNSLRDTDLNLDDVPYRVFFKKTPGYSTIDISDNGNTVTLTAYDQEGTEFYSTHFEAE
jgi:hypothetical protein